MGWPTHKLSLTDPPTHHQNRRGSIPVIKPEDLVEADGLIFGFPTRFGQPAAQMRALWDATGPYCEFACGGGD